MIFTHREKRKVSHGLTLQYDKTIYLIGDTKSNRKLIVKYIDVCEYVDGRIELQASGACLPYTTYDRLPEVNQGAMVENKRLGHVLQIAQLVQAERDNSRSQSGPARTHHGLPRSTKKPEPGKKRQRALDAKDMEKAIRQAALAT
ncbi:hypothetical protein [Noviherbaspirillum malthae]|uniref:hypothetical protein n=1 Tax=Noviherbaspirillum malthae TaxID=1260987 RepID=UPI00188E56EB|nr:hypothetical protein [Noviherbaspirillum malthae]